MTRKILSMVVLAAVTVAGIGYTVTPTAYAVTGREERVERVTERRCTIAQARLGVAKTRYENIKQRRVTKYTELAGRLDAAVERADEAGYDTAELEAARTAVKADIETYKTEAKQLYDALTNTEDAACEESEAPYLDTLGKARAELRNVREASLQVHQTFREEAVPELKELAKWAKEQQ